MDREYNEKIAILKRDYIDVVLRYLATKEQSTVRGGQLMDAHTIVYGLGDRDFTKSPPALHKFFVQTLADYNKDVALPRILNKPGKDIISEFSVQWQSYTILSYWLAKAFQYLERGFLKPQKDNTLCQTALNKFQAEVFTPVIKTIVKTLFEELEAERGGDLVDWVKVKKTLHCFRSMGMQKATIIKDDKGDLVWVGESNLDFYKQNFEDEFIRQTTDYYEIEARKWITSMSCPEYVNVASSVLKKEEEKASNFLDPETRPKLVRLLEDKVLIEYAEKVTNMDKTGVRDMLHSKRTEELKALATLFCRRPTTIPFILDKLRPYIHERGTALAADRALAEDPVQYISKLVELKREMDGLMRDAFLGVEQFVKVKDQAFSTILEEFELSPRFLAVYIDFLMRQGLKGKEAETEELINEPFSLFRLLKPKDIFTERHKELYALRLLQHTSISDAAEETFISKMKIELGTQYVSKYVQMGVDMRNSKEETEGFQHQSHRGVVQGVELTCKILTSGLWAVERSSECTLPEELKSCTKNFEHYYLMRHSNRHLTWSVSLGDCEIKSLGLKKAYNFITTVYQAVILDAFNKQDAYTYQDLMHQTHMADAILAKQLLNLTNPKMGKLLCKVNLKTPKFTPDERISANPDFSSGTLRPSFVPVGVVKKTVEEHSKENSEEVKHINKERATILQTIIVKIMKGRKQEKHNMLIDETIKQCVSFKPEPTMIKGQIEWLIEGDYMMRDDKDKSNYIYKP